MGPWLKFLAAAQTGGAAGVRGNVLWQQAAVIMALAGLQSRGKQSELYNILWMLVFGFATLNILALVTKHLEPEKNRMGFGEVLAILVVLLSLALLGWEMLNLFHVLPLKLHPR
jgi:FtsH-binding integral membrane protein